MRLPSSWWMPCGLVLAMGVCCMGSACSPSATPRTPTSNQTTSLQGQGKLVEPVGTLPSGPPTRCEGTTVPLELSVPQLSSWQRSDRKDAISFEHRPSSTTFTVRYWTSNRLVTAEQCEEQLLLLDPKAASQAEGNRAVEPMATRVFSPGADYRGSLACRVSRDAAGALFGSVHGVSAGVGHCVSFDARTSLRSADGEATLAERLNVLLNVVAASIKLRTVDTRGKQVPPGPFPQGSSTPRGPS